MRAAPDIDLVPLSTGTNNVFPVLTADGSKIVFASGTSVEDFDYYIMNTDGSQRVNLTNSLDRMNEVQQFSGFVSLFPNGTMKLNPLLQGW